jgi:hypothetical protein
MKRRKLLSFVMALVMLLVELLAAIPPVYASGGDYTGSAGFTVIAYPDGVRINMVVVPGATDYKVYMSTNSGLSDFSGVPCLLSSTSYQPFAYFTSGDKDKNCHINSGYH